MHIELCGKDVVLKLHTVQMVFSLGHSIVITIMGGELTHDSRTYTCIQVRYLYYTSTIPVLTTPTPTVKCTRTLIHVHVSYLPAMECLCRFEGQWVSGRKTIIIHI